MFAALGNRRRGQLTVCRPSGGRARPGSGLTRRAPCTLWSAAGPLLAAVRGPAGVRTATGPRVSPGPAVLTRQLSGA